MTVPEPHALALAAEGSLLVTLTQRERRPNLLVDCSLGNAELVMPLLTRWCQAPVHRCALPGQLRLPNERRGTLVLERVDTLTLRQQIILYDWLTSGRGRPQIVSIAERPVEALVEDGSFLEALFYRLNVIRLEARPARELGAD